MRTESDFIGEVKIPKDALFGIHSFRARNNFPDQTLFHFEWYKAVGLTKLACYLTYQSFKKAAKNNIKNSIAIEFFDDKIIDALIRAAEKVSHGDYFEHFIVPAIQGGAGTSINLNVNEIITNSALKTIGERPGDYKNIDPIKHANIFQSTNDVIPTSLKIAIIQLLTQLEDSINKLRAEIEKIEHKSRDILRIAYTQMQQAIPSSYGLLFSTYSDALSRDWWRVSKCFERIKVVNLGGGAIGTGISIPRYFIMEVVPTLQKLTNLPIARGENLSDTTNNIDSFVEVHAILKSHAVNLEKIAKDIRLLSSDIIENREIEIPQKQVGSSIMPGKVNPVISEFLISASHKVYANDLIIGNLAGQGCLDLNAYIPLIGHSIIDSLKLLIASNKTLKENLLSGLKINSKAAFDKLYKSPSITTALNPIIGYHKASEISKEMKINNIDVFEANKNLSMIDDDKLKELLKPQNLLKLGFSLKKN
ncbi:lyase family protein [Bacteroidota bacterium]